MNYIANIKERIKSPEITQTLSEDMIWQKHGPLIWQADEFIGIPSFYNVYRYKNFYSFSLLGLILLKGTLKLNKLTIDKTNAAGFSNHSGNYTIDQEIVKIGAPHQCRFDITDIDEYCALIADALIRDIELIEAKNPGKTNIIMCGGRDSMNLLLLPWKNPVIALSAEPNYSLVCDFVKNNNLNIRVRKLEDTQDEASLKDEIVEACCRADLVHWRWGADLRKVAEDYQRNAIIWKGQLGDTYLSNNWKDFITPYVEPKRTVRRIYKKFSYLLPDFINRTIGHKYQQTVVKRIWEVCSSLQGGHMCFLRGLLDMLVVSAYHGPNVSAVIEKADLGATSQKDNRPKIGKILLGREVIYPDTNPTPKISGFRENLHKPELFWMELEKAGIEIIHPDEN